MLDSEARGRPKRDPASLSSEYHRAHKQLMLWSAILFIWEFVGIDLEQAKSAEGYAGAVVKSLKSPQAVPWVLLILVVYFLFKCSVEWAQCHVDRRKVRFARVDFISALLVSGAAIALYVGQTISRLQFANVVAEAGRFNSISLGWALGLALGMLIAFALGSYLRKRWYFTGMSGRRRPMLVAFIAAPIMTLTLAITMLVRQRVNWIFVLVGLIVGIPLGIAMILWMAKIMEDFEQA